MRFEYWQRLRDIPVENLIFLDEAGVNLAFTRKLSRAIPGQRAYGEKPSNNRKNVSVIGAVSLKEVIVQWSG